MIRLVVHDLKWDINLGEEMTENWHYKFSTTKLVIPFLKKFIGSYSNMNMLNFTEAYYINENYSWKCAAHATMYHNTRPSLGDSAGSCYRLFAGKPILTVINIQV